MKKAIVTGASGFLGKYLVRELIRNQYKVWAIVRSENSDILDTINDDTCIIYCTMNDILSLPYSINERIFDVFFHMAWDGNCGKKREDCNLQLKNVKASVEAAEIAAILKCNRFIGAGSVTELMYRTYLTLDDCTPEMITCYAIGKISAEYLCRCICVKNNIEFIWPYIANFYGIGDKTNNFINFLIQNYSSGISPNLTDGNQMADFLYVSDVARALRLLGEKGRDKHTYYVGYGAPKPLKYFIKITRDIVNPNIDAGIGRKVFHGLDIDYDNIDIKKIERDTGFKPEIKFENGIYMLYQSIQSKSLMKIAK